MNQTFVLRDETVLKRLAAFLRANWPACAQQGRPLAVTVSEYKAKRSGEQNRLYWALLREIAGAAWVNGRQYDDETWHEHLKRALIGCEEIVLPDGAAIVRGISTTTLSVPEMSEYIDRVQQYAAEHLGMQMDAAL